MYSFPYPNMIACSFVSRLFLRKYVRIVDKGWVWLRNQRAGRWETVAVAAMCI